MPNCSNCGRSVEDKPKVCPHCGSPTRIDSPGLFGSHGLGCLIAVALGVGIVAVILLPVFASARTAAKRVRVVSQCKRIGIAMDTYLSDNNDRYPPMESSVAVGKRIEQYLQDSDELKLLECANKGTWNTALSGVPSDAIVNFNDIWVFYTERESDPNFGAMLFLGGTAKSANKFVFDNAMAAKARLVYPKDQKPTVFEPDK